METGIWYLFAVSLPAYSFLEMYTHSLYLQPPENKDKMRRTDVIALMKTEYDRELKSMHFERNNMEFHPISTDSCAIQSADLANLQIIAVIGT